MNTPRLTLSLFVLIFVLLYALTHAYGQIWISSEVNPYRSPDHPQHTVECCRGITVEHGEGTMVDIHVDTPSLGTAARENRKTRREKSRVYICGDGADITVKREDQ